MVGDGFLIFAGILAKVLLFAASIFITTFLVDFTSMGKYRWVPAVVIGVAILIFAIKNDLIISVFESFPTGLSWKNFLLTIFGGFVAGGLFSGV